MTQNELDNRGLSSPEPMVRILAALKTLEDDGRLVTLTDREPLLLFGELERRGYTWECIEDGDHFVVTIWRALWS